ncbi:MAG: 3-dehydroquinate synthase [Verrucomicrobia bacterium]|nr:MAG: 3-dehydroquinate synthase [Verrucomicrobiota bacterium]
MLTIKSRAHDYTVENFPDLASALITIPAQRSWFLIDKRFSEFYRPILDQAVPANRAVYVEATEEQKSFEALTPIFLDLLKRELKRDGLLIVIGGGVLQDIGAFIATVLFRGLRWELIPTTLLAQADSCIGSKSSINIGPYKNQIGTFCPPNRIQVTSSVLATLPWDEIRSGLGEVIKLQLLSSEKGFRELMDDLKSWRKTEDREQKAVAAIPAELLSKWVSRSLEVKKPYVEADEFDKGIRNILNYGHTFGHAYESATHYGIPHGIGVVLGMLTATYLSVRLGLAEVVHYQELKTMLQPWHEPYSNILRKGSRDEIFQAIKHDKKNTGQAVNCILTRGFGRMEKMPVPLAEQLVPAVNDFIERECGSA